MKKAKIVRLPAAMPTNILLDSLNKPMFIDEPVYHSLLNYQYLYIVNNGLIYEDDYFIQFNDDGPILRKAVSFDFINKNVNEKFKSSHPLQEFFELNGYYPYPMVRQTLQSEYMAPETDLIDYRMKVIATTDTKLYLPEIDTQQQMLYVNSKPDTISDCTFGFSCCDITVNGGLNSPDCCQCSKLFLCL